MDDKNAYTIVCAIWTLYWIISMCLFHGQRRDIFITKRRPNVMLLNNIASLALFYNWMADLKRFQHLAWQHYIRRTIVVYVFGVRLFLFYIYCLIHRIYAVVVEYYLNKFALIPSNNREAVYETLSYIERLLWHKLRGTDYFLRSLTSQSELCKIDDQERQVTHHKPQGTKMCTNNQAALMYGAVIVVYMILWVSMLFWGGHVDGNPNAETIELLPIFFIILVYLASMWFFWYTMRRVQDSFYITIECLAGLLVFACFFLLYLIDFYGHTDLIPDYGSSFFLILMIVYTHTVYCFVPSVCGLILHWKRDNSVMNNAEGLHQVLRTPALYQEFEKRLAKDMSVENGRFWQVCQRLADAGAIGKESPEFHTNAILNIYHTYIALGSRYELNLTATARKKVKEIIEKGGPYNTSIFADIKVQVFTMMLTNSYPRFSEARELDRRSSSFKVKRSQSIISPVVIASSTT